MNGKLEEHLQNIGDFVQIDDKIVTYKWICKALKVHSNTAKQLLYSFTKKPEVKDQLLITYIVAGELDGGSGLNFRLVREDELEETKKKFSKVTSVHVYSVQKGSTVSVADIYNADSAYKLSPEDQMYCSIQPAEDIKLREIKIPPPRTEPGPSVATKKPVTSQSTTPADHKTKEPDSSKEESKEVAAKRTSPRKASPKKNDSKKPAAATKRGGIGALFMKQAAKKKDDTAIKATKEKEDNNKKAKDISDEKEKENTEASKEEIKKKIVSGKETEKETVKTPSAKSKSQSKSKRKKPSHSKDSAAKRRKRIQVASDSESTEASESDGDQRYPSPEPEPEAPTVIESDEEIIPATPVEKGRKRFKKLVDRTFEDDEGYINGPKIEFSRKELVLKLRESLRSTFLDRKSAIQALLARTQSITKKEYVFESCSDDESCEPSKKTTESDSSKETTSSKAEEKSVKEPQKQSTSEAKKEDSKKKDTKKSQEGKKTESTTKKRGRPPSKAKASGGSSPKKQASIMNFFKKT